MVSCPFDVPKFEYHSANPKIQKCDMCYDRTSVGKKPMCATVCPSGALFYGTREQMEKERPRSRPINEFRFGQQTVKTKVNVLIPRDSAEQQLRVTDALERQPDILLLGMYQEEEP